MSVQKKLGDDIAETGLQYEKSTRDACVVTIEGSYDSLKSENAVNHCPSGYSVESSTVSTTGDGFGKMTIRCVKYNTDVQFNAEVETVRVDMQEVTHDLEDHPYMKDARYIILAWLATEPSVRADGTGYKFRNENGVIVSIGENDTAKLFCDAYMAGITQFVRFYPVIEKTGIWKNPPGISISGGGDKKKSFNSGTAKFSENIGNFDYPPISLEGYSNDNFFKSKDSWVQNADSTWTRTEQWTYTPEGRSSDHAWIYDHIDA